MDAYLADGTWPAQLDLRIEGLRLTPQRAGAAALRLDVALRLDWDAGTGTLLLDGPHADLPGDNAISMGARIDGIAVVSPARAAMALGAGSLREFTLDLTSDGMMADHLTGLGRAPKGGRPADLSEIEALIATLPDTLIDGAIAWRTGDLARALPRPKGLVLLGGRAENGYALGRLWHFFGPHPPTTAAGVAKVLKGVALYRKLRS